MTPSGIVTLVTDFGLSDTYVGEMHAVLQARNPGVTVIDVSHGVPFGSLDSTLYLTERAWPAFPPGTVHLVVVDPGVGGDRRLVAIASEGNFYIGPDTGVLSSGLPDALRPRDAMRTVALPAAVTAVEISGSTFRREPVSNTFHGRDLMAPVGAVLAADTPIAQTGASITEVRIAPPLPATLNGGRGTGHIMHIDSFGNAITNFRTADAAPTFLIEVGDAGAATSVKSYTSGPPDHPVALGGSGGYIEIAWPRGSAADRLGLHAGTPVRIRPVSALKSPR